MALDLGAWETENEPWDGGNTLVAELPAFALSTGQPENVVDMPRSDGITFSGILSGVDRTADTLLQTFGKYYSLGSKVEDMKFSRTVQAATLDLQRAQALGTLDAQRAAVDASVAIEKARAARATGDALAQVRSGGAGFVNMGGVSPMIVILGLVGLFVVMRRGKA